MSSAGLPEIAAIPYVAPLREGGSMRGPAAASPSSTIVQPSAVHSGLCADPSRTLDELFARLVE